MTSIDTIRLDQACVVRKLCTTRREAQELIEKGLVCVNNEVCSKQIRKITPTDVVEVKGKRKYVSRGGDKLEGALYEVFGSKQNTESILEGLQALDIGASTGGFTECLLAHGVVHIDAVDVGSEQLHTSLQSDVRVTSYEKTDIRMFMKEMKYDIIVTDLSFISLRAIKESLEHFSKKGTHFFLLIKPQFEVGKGNTKKGIVKDTHLAKKKVIEIVEEIKTIGVNSIVTFECSLTGGDGNQEYFLYATKD